MRGVGLPREKIEEQEQCSAADASILRKDDMGLSKQNGAKTALRPRYHVSDIYPVYNTPVPTHEISATLSEYPVVTPRSAQV